MFVNKLLALGLAIGAAVVVPLHNVQAAPANECKIVAPPEGWPNPIPGYPTGLHIGMDTDWSKQMRPIGDVKAIMLFVDFPNAVASSGTQAYYDHLVPNAVQFFRTVSYGQFRLTVDAPQRWYRMSRNDRDYGFAYLTPPEVQAVYIDEAMRLADNDVDFSQYQAVYVVPPRNASAMAFSPEWNDYRGVVVHDGKVFKNGVTFGQDAWYWGYKIFNHENGHDMGLPEDYNATGQGPTFAFTGGWDVMGNLGGHAPDLFAWEKWKLGWLTDSQVACVRGAESATVTLSPIEQAGGTKMAVVRTGRDTAWVAEVRQRIGVDSGACDKGVLIYKVDSSKTNGAGTIRVSDSHPNTSACNDPFGDAPYDLGPGEVAMFYDAATRTRFELLATAGSGYTVRVTAGLGSAIFSDDFETDRGWTVNAAGTDTATTGRWERGVAGETSYQATVCQLVGTSNALVTGLLGGVDCALSDVDGGFTSVTSPAIALPSGQITLSFRYYLAHLNNATSADHLRVKVGGTTVFERKASASNVSAAWQNATVNLSAYAGQTIQLVIEVADHDTPSLVESAIDNLTLTRS